MDPKIKFVSSAAFQRLLTEKGDTANIGILKSAPVLGDLTKAVDRQARTIDFIISTAGVDRDNDTIDVSGWNIGNYVKNPVVLFAHDHWQPPVAQALNVTTESGALKSKAYFTPKDLYPFGDMIFEFYAQGFMRATSVGYKPEEFKFNDDRKYGVDFLKQELLEYSCVPVPSNPEALVSAKAAGIDVNPLKAWCERLLDDQRMLKEANGSTREVIERIRELTIDGKSLFVHMGDIKMPREKKEPEPVPAPSREIKMFSCKTDHTSHRTVEDADLCDLRTDLSADIVRSYKLFHPTSTIDITEKVGRVLSAANETRLRGAAAKGDEMAALIREVLTQLEDDDEDDDKSVKADAPDFFTFDKDPDDLGIDEATMRETLATMLGDELRTQLRDITGRVD